MTSNSVRSLAERLDGRLLTPGDPGYAEARKVWNAMVDRRPRMIVRCASRADVASAVRFARDQDLEIGVRCGATASSGWPFPTAG
jgi:FAD/FMN-containing dehydrogenase